MTDRRHYILAIMRDDKHAAMQVIDPDANHVMQWLSFEGGRLKDNEVFEAHEALLVPISRVSLSRIRDFVSNYRMLNPRSAGRVLDSKTDILQQLDGLSKRSRAAYAPALKTFVREWNERIDRYQGYGDTTFDLLPKLLDELDMLGEEYPKLKSNIQKYTSNARHGNVWPYFFASQEDSMQRFSALEKYKINRKGQSHQMEGKNCMQMVRYVCSDIGGIPLEAIHPGLGSVSRVGQFDEALNALAGCDDAPKGHVWAHVYKVDGDRAVGVLKAPEGKTMTFPDALGQIDAGDKGLIKKLKKSATLFEPGRSVTVGDAMSHRQV